MSVRAKAVVVIDEVEGEPLEPSYVDEGEGRSSRQNCWGEDSTKSRKRGKAPSQRK